MTMKNAKARARRFFVLMASGVGLGQLLRRMENGGARLLESGQPRLLENE